MENSYLIWAIIFALVSIGWAVFLGLKRGLTSRTYMDFFVEGQPISRNRIIATFAATNSALALIVFWFSYLGWFYGIGAAFWLLVCWIAGLELFAALSKKWKDFPYGNIANSKSLTYQTLHEYATAKVGGNGARRALAYISITTFLLMVNVELYRGTKVISIFSDFNFPFSVETLGFLILLCVAVYAAIGGFRAVLSTDKVQWGFTAVAILLSLVFAIYGILSQPEAMRPGAVLGGSSLLQLFLIPTGLFFIVGSLFSWTFWFVVTMDMWQRAAAARRINIIDGQTRLILYPWFLVITLSAVSIGVFVRVHDPGVDVLIPALRFLEILPGLLEKIGGLGPILFGLIFAGFLTSMLSTVDTYFVVIAHSIFKDLPNLESTRGWEQKRLNRFTVTLSTLAVAITGYPIYLALNRAGFDMNTLLYIATSLPFVLLPAILLRLTIFGKTKLGIITGVGLGAISTILYIQWLLIEITNARAEGNWTALGEAYNLLYLAPMVAAFSALVGHVAIGLIESWRLSNGKQPEGEV